MAKQIPLRMCIACRQMKNKGSMLKIVKNKEGQIFIDPSGKAAGRGAYICAEPVCHTKLAKQRLINRAFSCEVEKTVYEQIEEYYKIQN